MPQRKQKKKTKMQQRNSDESAAASSVPVPRTPSLALSLRSTPVYVCSGDAMLRVVRVQGNICVSSHAHDSQLPVRVWHVTHSDFALWPTRMLVATWPYTRAPCGHGSQAQTLAEKRPSNGKDHLPL